MPLEFTGGTSTPCSAWDNNVTVLNDALVDAEIVTNGLITLTKVDGSSFTNNIPYFPNFVVSGLSLNISNVPVNRTLTYTAGTYQINAQVYSIPTGANFQLTAGHPTLPRIDILYLTNTNNIFYQTGTPSISPVQPAAPAGTLLLAAIGVQINATTSLDYTLVTVNTNSSNIVSPLISPGSITGSHLFWNNIAWVENTFWNVSNSTFDPTARIHTYTSTDSFGILTSNKLGDSAGERGFNRIVNHTLNGFVTQMDITTDGGETFFTLDSSDSNLFEISSIWNSAARNTFISSSNTTDRSTEILQLNSSINLTASKEAFDATHFSRVVITSNHPVKPSTTITTVKNDNTNSLGVGADTISLSGLNLDYEFKTTQDISTGKYETDLSNLLNTDNINFKLDLFNKQNSLSLTDGTNTSEFIQDLGTLQNTLSITDGINNCRFITDASATPFISLNLNDNLSTQYNTALQLTPSNSAFLYSDLINGITSNIGLSTIGVGISHIKTLLPNEDVTLIIADGKINLDGGIIKKQRNTSISTAIVENDYMLVATTNPLTFTLPSAPINGQELVFKAITATVPTPVTIDGNGKNIDSSATATITTNYDSITIVFNTALNEWLTRK